MLLAVAFAVAHTQSPLYFSNQNQYFLHGLAAGGHGHLDRDWLANTRDPTPVFSALVAAGYRHLGEWSFQAAYFLVLMGYFLSARWLVAALPGMPDSRAFRLAFAALFTAAHAAVLRVASVELTGVDYPWYLQCGVANQYLLGTGLQPSAFGVLLLTALAAFANDRPVLAAALAGLACAFHSTYLLAAGSLVLGIVVVTVVRNPRGGPVAFRAVLAFSAVAAPVSTYALFTFGSENPVTFAESQRILAEVRIPHHAVIDRWFAAPDAVQLAWAAVGLVLLRRSPLAVVLLIAAAIGLVLTLIQYETGNHTLALLFPWRISAVLVPVATAVIAARAAALISSPPPLWGRSASEASRVGDEGHTTPHPNPPPQGGRERDWVELAAGVIVLLLAAGGVWVTAAGVGYRTPPDEQELLDYVRTHGGPSDVYLLPVKFPPVSLGRGTASTTFTPPPRPKPDSPLIPVDLQRFRLHTGAPIYVDFKSVPYFDQEVLEWQRRMRQCEAWYAGDWTALGRAQELRGEGITHVVAPAAKPLPPTDSLEVVHSDDAYIVYRVK
jgi:hypothetical protein